MGRPLSPNDVSEVAHLYSATKTRAQFSVLSDYRVSSPASITSDEPVT